MFPIPSLDKEVNYDMSQDYQDFLFYSKLGRVEAAAARMNFYTFFDSFYDFALMPNDQDGANL